MYVEVCLWERERNHYGLKEKNTRLYSRKAVFIVEWCLLDFLLLEQEEEHVFVFVFSRRADCVRSRARGNGGKISVRRVVVLFSPLWIGWIKQRICSSWLTFFFLRDYTHGAHSFDDVTTRDSTLFLVRLSCHFCSLLFYLNNVILMICKHRL